MIDNNWIPVAERLPEESEIYIVWVKFRKHNTEDEWGGGTIRMEVFNLTEKKFNIPVWWKITHWQHKPLPPEAE